MPDAPRPWTWLRQVHGAGVVEVTRPGEHGGVEADAAVTVTPGCTLVVRTADCAPLVLTGTRGVGVVHAGWRGLVAGVVERAVEALRQIDAGPIAARLGPCIRGGCYEFAGPELEVVTAELGASVATSTLWGTPGLDLPEAVRLTLGRAGVEVLTDEAGCTACDRRWYSHRARGEVARFATLAWLEP